MEALCGGAMPVWDGVRDILPVWGGVRDVWDARSALCGGAMPVWGGVWDARSRSAEAQCLPLGRQLRALVV